MLTYHRTTHLYGSCNGLFEVRAGTFLLEAKKGPIDILLATAQAGGVAVIARTVISGGQTGKGTAWNERKRNESSYSDKEYEEQERRTRIAALPGL